MNVSDKLILYSIIISFLCIALQAFLHGLETNTTCKTLELKVNIEK